MVYIGSDFDLLHDGIKRLDSWWKQARVTTV